MEEQKYDFVKEVIRKKEPLWKQILRKMISFVGLAVVFLAGVLLVIFILRDDLKEFLRVGDGFETVQETDRIYVAVNSGTEKIEDDSRVQEKIQQCMVSISGTGKDAQVLCRGVILHKNQDVYVLTSNRELENHEEFKVLFKDGAVAVGSLWNRDEKLGVAAIKVAGDEIPMLTMQSVAAGILTGSGLQKKKDYIYVGCLEEGKEISCTGTIFEVEQDKKMYDISPRRIATDLKLGGERSGFLFDGNGTLIGISLGKEKDGEAISALAFYDIYDIIYRMLNKQEMSYIGIQGQYVDYNIKKYIGGDIPDGFFVQNVDADGGAYQAGIMRGDVILTVEDMVVETMDDITHILLKKQPGDKVTVVLDRKLGQEYEQIEVEVLLGNRWE